MSGGAVIFMIAYAGAGLVTFCAIAVSGILEEEGPEDPVAPVLTLVAAVVWPLPAACALVYFSSRWLYRGASEGRWER